MSAKLDAEGRTRLDGLLERFDLAQYRDLILAQAEPCIAIALGDPPEEHPDPWPEPPVGVSKVGGLPDLPRDCLSHGPRRRREALATIRPRVRLRPDMTFRFAVKRVILEPLASAIIGMLTEAPERVHQGRRRS